MVKLQSTTAIIDALGGNAAVAKMLTVTSAAISNWRAADRFPSNTYLILTEALARKDYVAPDKLWAMRKKAVAHG
jgi:hypothetical protein